MSDAAEIHHHFQKPLTTLHDGLEQLRQATIGVELLVASVGDAAFGAAMRPDLDDGPMAVLAAAATKADELHVALDDLLKSCRLRDAQVRHRCGADPDRTPGPPPEPN